MYQCRFFLNGQTFCLNKMIVGLTFAKNGQKMSDVWLQFQALQSAATYMLLEHNIWTSAQRTHKLSNNNEIFVIVYSLVTSFYNDIISEVISFICNLQCYSYLYRWLSCPVETGLNSWKRFEVNLVQCNLAIIIPKIKCVLSDLSNAATCLIRSGNCGPRGSQNRQVTVLENILIKLFGILMKSTNLSSEEVNHLAN